MSKLLENLFCSKKTSSGWGRTFFATLVEEKDQLVLPHLNSPDAWAVAAAAAAALGYSSMRAIVGPLCFGCCMLDVNIHCLSVVVAHPQNSVCKVMRRMNIQGTCLAKGTCLATLLSSGASGSSHACHPHICGTICTRNCHTLVSSQRDWDRPMQLALQVDLQPLQKSMPY